MGCHWSTNVLHIKHQPCSDFWCSLVASSDENAVASRNVSHNWLRHGVSFTQRKQLNRSGFLLIHQLLKWQNYYIRFAYSTFLIFLISVGFYTSLYFLWDSFTYMVCKYIYTLFAIEIGTNVLYINRSCFSMLKMVMIILSLHLCQFLYLNLLFYCYFISWLYGFILNKYLNPVKSNVVFNGSRCVMRQLVWWRSTSGAKEEVDIHNQEQWSRVKIDQVIIYKVSKEVTYIF